MNKEEIREAVSKLPVVEMKSIYVPVEVTDKYDNKGTELKKVPKHWAIVETGTNNMFASASKRYKILQFNNQFTPILNQFDDNIIGQVFYYDGKALMSITPTGEQYLTTDGMAIGITAYNSVNKSCAVNVLFHITDGKRIFTIPRRKAGFKKNHTGMINSLTKDYIALLDSIKGIWANVIEKHSKVELTLEQMDDVCKALDIPETMAERLKPELGIKYKTLWDFCMVAFNEIANDNTRYKIDYSRQIRLNKLTEKILLLNIISEM